MMAIQAVVSSSGISLFACVEIAFDWSSSNGSPQIRSMFSGISSLNSHGEVTSSDESMAGGPYGDGSRRWKSRRSRWVCKRGGRAALAPAHRAGRSR
jgi:hypothetical protein